MSSPACRVMKEFNGRHGRCCEELGTLFSVATICQTHIGNDAETWIGYFMLSEAKLKDLAAKLKRGQNKEVITECRRLIKNTPKNGALCEMLGIAYAKTGDPQNAVKWLTRATKIKPDQMSAKFNLAKVYLDSGRVKLAISILEGIIKDGDATENVCRLLGIALFQIGDHVAAAKQFDRVLDHAPQNQEAQFYQGRIARASGDDSAALERFLAVLQITPDHFEATFNIGNIHRDNRQPAEALVYFNKALSLKPDHLQSLMNRGILQVQIGHPDKAIQDFEACLSNNPDYMEAYQNLSAAHLELRNFAAAENVLDLAIQRNPDFIDAVFAKFGLLALQGRFEDAFPLGEARLDPRIRFEPAIKFNSLADNWDGTPLAGKRLLIRAEQGIGDTIMFMRFLDQLPADLEHVEFSVQQPLVDLVAQQFPKFKITGQETSGNRKSAVDPLPDAQCALLSLPYLLDITKSGSLFAHARQLEVPDRYISMWKRSLREKTEPRIGFVFRGNSRHRNDFNRSIDLASFLTCLPKGYDYHFLGIDLEAEEEKLLQAHGGVTVHKDQIENLCDTAALILQMDRVVSVDTSVAHLAAGLNVDTHILLPYTPDWRWGLGTSDSIWYPSVTLHRQCTHGDWKVPLKAVADGIRQLPGCR
ncbi:MAG: tetratricopeptide repeat protein [Candidatus Puniceispirillaceae bacterium]